MAQTWLIASGKGGVGKSTITAALGQALARRGRSVCIVDADIGLRDQDVLLGLQDHVVYDLMDVLNKRCPVERALITLPGQKRLSLLPAAQFARVKDVDLKAFRKLLAHLDIRFDVVLIDCPAGLEKGLRNVLAATGAGALIVATPDDVCLRDAERVVSLLRAREDKDGRRDARLIVNRLMPDLIRAGEMMPAQAAAQTLELPLAGEIPQDAAVYRAQLRGVSLMDCDCEAARALGRIAARLDGEQPPLPGYGAEKRRLRERLRHRVKELKLIDR